MFRLGSSLFITVLCFAGTSAMAQSMAKPTDPQIAHIAYTAGLTEEARKHCRQTAVEPPN